MPPTESQIIREHRAMRALLVHVSEAPCLCPPGPGCIHRVAAGLVGEVDELPAGLVTIVRFAVRFGNYEPAEIDSTWPDESAADARADELNESGTTTMWEVVPC